MQSNYKKLGDYIQTISKRNIGLVTKDLQGLSMTKEFRKSTSNIIGTDLSKYKLVEKNQFACDFMSVIRVHKFPVVLHTSEDPVIVSPAYIVFEITNMNILDPEYLMMWFRRSEYDRYADFRCDSSIRGGFKWDELCESQIPIPNIEKQQEIVAEYNTVVKRIKLNEQLNQKLEETAQAIYKHWFIDFEFPFDFAQGMPNKDEKPYKSSGGKMVYNEELDKDVPEGWGVEPIESVISVKDGTHDSPKPSSEGFPLITSTHLKEFDIAIDEAYLINEEDYKQINKRSKVDQFDILFSMIGTVGIINYVQNGEINFAIKNVGLFKSSENKILSEYIFLYLKSQYTNEYIESNLAGSTQSYVTLTTLRNIPLLLPKSDIISNFNDKVVTVIRTIHSNSIRINKLFILKNLLLSKMTKG